jgi:hypothetical protein
MYVCVCMYIYKIELLDVTVFLHKVVIYIKTTIDPFLSSTTVCVCVYVQVHVCVRVGGGGSVTLTEQPYHIVKRFWSLFIYCSAKIFQVVRKKWQPYALMSLFDQKVIDLRVYT